MEENYNNEDDYVEEPVDETEESSGEGEEEQSPSVNRTGNLTGREAFLRGAMNHDYYKNQRSKLHEDLNKAKAEKLKNYKMQNGHEKEKPKEDGSNTENKNIIDKAKDRGNLLNARRNILGSYLDQARGLRYAASDPKEAAKEYAKAKAKDAAKKKMLMLLKLIPWWVWLIIAGVILLLIAIFMFASWISIDNDGTSGSTNYVATSPYLNEIYSECQTVNVNGKIYTLDEYVAGVVQHEAYTTEDMDALKAQAITARTYGILSSKENGVYCSRKLDPSQKTQTFNPNYTDEALQAAQETSGMVLTYNGELFSTQYDNFCYNDSRCPDSVKNADGTYTVTYTKLPTEETHKITLNEPKYYNWIVESAGHARGMSQLVSYQLANQGYSYEEILKYFYSDGVQISNLFDTTSSTISNGETISNTGDGYYTTFTSSNGKTYLNFKQTYYTETGLNSTGATWLNSSGCGLTSAVTIISGKTKYVNNSSETLTPMYFYNNYRAVDGNVYMGKYFEDYGIKYQDSKVSKDELKTHLSNGGEAIMKVDNSCKINEETWTSSQHYFALLDYNSSNNQVYVSNPGTQNESKNGWISLDSIMGCATVSYLTN